MISQAHSFHPACRCGQGAAKNKQEGKFCAEYKSGSKCFRSLKGCAAMCGCRNCANPYMECEYKEKMKYHQESRHEISAESIRNLLRQGEIS